MISMYAEYSGRTLYVALSSDTIDGAKNGDTLYEMDTGKRYVYNESNDAWDEQPEEGGGKTYPVSVQLINRRSVSVTLQFGIVVNGIPGVFGLNQNMGTGANATVTVPNMAIQDGRFTIRGTSKAPSNVLYNGTKLGLIKGNYAISVPYVGSEFPYELMFS